MFPLITFVVLLFITPIKPDSNYGLNTVQIVEKSGYKIELHYVVTEDGYILTLHRVIPQKSNQKAPILIWPGLLCSAADFVVLGNLSIGLLLANQGFDVWLGNERGSTWSRNHTTLSPDKQPEKFFNFTFHEIGLYDISACTDYIISITRFPKIYYIGYSQGGQSFFILNSVRTEYNEKFIMATGLAPSSYQGQTRSLTFRVLAKFNKLLKSFFDVFRIHEFFPTLKIYGILAKIFCNTLFKATNICLYGIGFVTGFDNIISSRFPPAAFTNFPSGTSTKHFIHIMQVVDSNRFCEFDYGQKKNVKYYGTPQPPAYNISNFKVPMRFIAGQNDLLVDYKDVERISKEISSTIEFRLVPWARFNHFDQIWSYRSKDLVYDDVISKIENYPV